MKINLFRSTFSFPVSCFPVNYFPASLILIVLLFPVSVIAETKIGFVNSAIVFEKSPQADQARELIQKEFAPRDKVILGMQNDLKKLEEQLARDAAVMSATKRRDLEREILVQQREIKRMKQEFREDLNIRRNEVLEKLHKRVMEVIRSMAKKKKFDLIVSEGVSFASKRIDITDDVLKQLKNEMTSKKK